MTDQTPDTAPPTTPPPTPPPAPPPTQPATNNVVSLSGGKDSTAMLHMMLDHKEPIYCVVYFECDWDFPQMQDHLTRIEKNTGLHIERIRTYRHFNDLLRFKGWPHIRGGWCTTWKVDSLIKYTRTVPFPTECIGFSTDERSRALRPGLYKKRKWPVRFPLIEWDITESEALEYCYDLGYDWGGLYEHFDRVSCFCCPKAGKLQHERIQEHYPDLWQRWLDLDKIAGIDPKPLPSRALFQQQQQVLQQQLQPKQKSPQEKS